MGCLTTKTLRISYSRSSSLATNGQANSFRNGTCTCFLSTSTPLIRIGSELFGDEDSTRLYTESTESPDSFLAMVKEQLEGCHAQKMVDEQVPGEDPGRYHIS
jgi:hypothetical protein